MHVAATPWSAFRCVRERLKAQLQILVIDWRDDPCLVQSQVYIIIFVVLLVLIIIIIIHIVNLLSIYIIIYT